MSDAPRDPQGRRRKPRRSSQGPLSPAARAERVVRDLRVLTHQLGHELPGGVAQMPAAISLALELQLSKEGGDKQASAQLIKGLQETLLQARQAQAPFPTGRVPCFRAGHADGPQSLPPTATSVFNGHAATGKPTWIEFTSLCLERRDPRVSALYRDPPAVIGLVQEADDLGEALLPEFHAQGQGYQVLGQVAVGLVPGPALGVAGDVGRVAFSLQVVSVSGPGGDRLYLNPVGVDERALLEAAQGGSDRAEGLLKAIKSARRRLRAVKRRQITHRERNQRGPDVAQVLHRTKVEVERALSPDRRRTQHAQDRHQSGQRPTLSAVGDATAAPLERLLEDTQRKTIVVLGPKGRAHIFSKDGRHVTSLKLEPGELERKTIRRRWRPLSEAQARQFQASLSARARRAAD